MIAKFTVSNIVPIADDITRPESKNLNKMKILP